MAGMERISEKTPVFFKRKPVTEETPPDAVVFRFKQSLRGEDVYEITYRQEIWTVRRCDIKTVHEALAHLGDEWFKKIKAALDKTAAQGILMREKMLARHFSISVGTFRKRMGLVTRHSNLYATIGFDSK